MSLSVVNMAPEAYDCGTAVEHSTCHPKVHGLSRAILLPCEHIYFFPT
jgi:hypothetical protein